MLYRTRTWCALLSLCLSLSLTACGATTPVVLSDPEIVEIEKLVRVQVPGHLLADCDITPLPEIGSNWTWFEVFELVKQKDSEQVACNKHFGIIKEWMSSEP